MLIAKKKGNKLRVNLIPSSLLSTGDECEHGLADMSLEDEMCIPLPRLAVRSGPREKIYFDPSKVCTALECLFSTLYNLWHKSLLQQRKIWEHLLSLKKAMYRIILLLI